MPAITRSLNVLARLGQQYRNAHLEDTGLTAIQAPYVLHIHARPGLSQEELARALRVNPSNATRQLSMLEKAGFVTRAHSKQDKRRMELYPTQLAVDTVPKVLLVNQAWNQVLTQGMTGEDQQRLISLLEIMLEKAMEWEADRQ